MVSEVILKKLKNIKQEVVVFLFISLFYFFLWFVGPSNKQIIFYFFLLFAGLTYILKSYRYSLLLTYIASLIILTGKTYEIQLIYPDVYSDVWYADGYKINFTIAPTLIVSFFMCLVLIRDVLLKNLYKINLEIKIYDVFLLFTFLSVIITDVFISNLPYISTLLSLSGLNLFIAYVYIRVYLRSFKNSLTIILIIISSQLLFESIVSLHQFVGNSPIFTSIQGNIALNRFGEASDELINRFRPFGTMGHANDFAAWLGFNSLLLFFINYFRKNYSLFILNALCFLVLAMTLSRGAWLGTFVGLLVGLFYLEKVKKTNLPTFLAKLNPAIIFLSLVTIFIFIYPRVEKSLFAGMGGIQFRRDQIESSSPLLKSNYLFGVGSSMSIVEGLRTMPEGFFSRYPLSIHNWFLLYIVEHGVISFIFLTGFFMLILKDIIITKLESPEFKFWKLGLITGSVCLIVVALFQPYLWESLIIIYSAIIVSVNQKHA